MKNTIYETTSRERLNVGRLVGAGLLCLAGFLIAGLATAQEEEAPVSVEQRLVEIVDLARSSSEIDHRYNVETLSCGELDHLAASESADDRAVVAMLMVWAHGYQSGLEGLNFHARPMDMEALVTITRSVLEHCEKTPEKLFHIAVTEIEVLDRSAGGVR